MTNVNLTTLCFSRRTGEALRGADYARSVEPPDRDAIRFSGPLVAALVVLSLVAALFLVQ
jgi:hypothetical protein